MARAKAESAKSERDKSPNKTSKTEPSSSKTFRKSPARTERQKSQSTAANTTSSPSGRGPIGNRSPARRSPGRKSPGRKSPTLKSPARKSPARKSPTRKPATPGRKSPGRSVKAEKSEPEKSKATGRSRKEIIEHDSDSDSVDVGRHINAEKPKAAVRGRARRLDSDYVSPMDIQTLREEPSLDREISSYVGLVRRSFRKSQSREVDRIVHLKHNDSTARKLTEFSDEDDMSTVRSHPVREKSERYSETRAPKERIPKSEFGGWIGALFFIITTPLIIIGLCVFCNETHCSLIKMPNFQRYKYVSTFIDTTALLMFSAFCFLMAILTAIPFGGFKVSGMPNKEGKLEYVTNGIFAVVVTGLGMFVLEMYGVPISSYITQKYFQFTISSIIVGVLFAIFLYVHSFFVPISALNPYATSSSRIHNLWVGREINPRPFGIDTKLFLLKVFSVGVVLVNASFMSKDIQFRNSSETASTIEILKSIEFNPTLMVLTMLQIIYAVDFILFEYVFLSSFEIQYEAYGYMSSVLGFTAPFVTALFPKYVYEYGIKLPTWQLVVATLVFLIGYFIYRGSNLQKYTFRLNPYSPLVSHFETIPTSQGKKLLVSGFWGYLRHPNYLGDLMMWSSFAIFAWNVPPVFVTLCDYVFLIHRAHRDGTRCKQRYGSAWDRYCQRVKYVMFPKVY